MGEGGNTAHSVCLMCFCCSFSYMFHYIHVKFKEQEIVKRCPMLQQKMTTIQHDHSGILLITLTFCVSFFVTYKHPPPEKQGLLDH